jgi:hypothetical protein
MAVASFAPDVPSTGAINVKNSRKTSTEILKRVRAVFIAVVALCGGPALAYDSWVEDHVAASYDYVLFKGPAAGRTVLVAAADPVDPDAAKGKSTLGITTSPAGRKRPDAGRAEGGRLAPHGANRLAQWPGCAGAAAIVPPRGTH